MTRRKTAYELSESQVSTPHNVVSLSWKLAHRYREHFDTVLDMGAGDCRFASGGDFARYVGVEIDESRTRGITIGQNVHLVHDCAFQHSPSGYDACVGNPPYVRHHFIDSPWKEETVARLERDLRITFNRHSNLYLYFLSLAILKTHDEGLLALVIPYEWVSRPSAKSIRGYIEDQKWDVHVYRFSMPIFDGVLTTASISIIDKSRKSGNWEFSDILADYTIQRRSNITDSPEGVLKYAPRGSLWALRGLSPGSQKLFTLTEGERIHHGLSDEDVTPCVTTLRALPKTLRELTRPAFRKHFVRTGEKCWLIKSHESIRTERLDAYLNAIPATDRDNYTCRNQTPWFKYLPHPIPRLLVSSGFTAFGPKVLINSVGACAVGSVFGVHSKRHIPARRLQDYLLGINLEKRVVAHANSLKKLEVKQLNAVLNAFVEEDQTNGKS